MAKLQDLQKYLDYEFSTGCYTSEDYKTFERKYINYLKALCKENGWEFLWGHKNHSISQPVFLLTESTRTSV